MAVVEYSQALMNRVVALLCQPGFGVGGSGYIGSTSGGSVINPTFPLFPYTATYTSMAGIYIMKGTKPTNFTALTTYASGPTSDILVYFNSTSQFTSISTANNKFTLTTAAQLALASGTAAWFWAIGPAEYNPATVPINDAKLCQQFIGTVGVSGSGADLTISDTNVVVGNPYSINSLIISISPTYTV